MLMFILAVTSLETENINQFSELYVGLYFFVRHGCFLRILCQYSSKEMVK